MVNFSRIVCPFLVQLVDATFIGASSNTFEIIHLVRTCAYQGIRKVSVSENFVNTLNKWYLFSFTECVTVQNFTDLGPTETVARRISVKIVFLRTSQNSLENTCARASFIKRDSDTGVFWWIWRNFKEHLLCCTSANGRF